MVHLCTDKHESAPSFSHVEKPLNQQQSHVS